MQTLQVIHHGLPHESAGTTGPAGRCYGTRLPEGQRLHDRNGSAVTLKFAHYSAWAFQGSCDESASQTAQIRAKRPLTAVPRVSSSEYSPPYTNKGVPSRMRAQPQRLLSNI